MLDIKAVNSVSRSQIGSACSLSEAQESRQAAVVLPSEQKKLFLWLCFGFWIPTELVIYLFVLMFEWYLNFKWRNSVMLLLGEEKSYPNSFNYCNQLFAAQFGWYIQGYSKYQLCPTPKAFSALFQVLCKAGILGCWLSWHKTALGVVEEICDCSTWLKLLSPLPLTSSALCEPDVFSWWTVCTE